MRTKAWVTERQVHRDGVELHLGYLDEPICLPPEDFSENDHIQIIIINKSRGG